MTLLVHIFLFVFSAGVIWFFAGQLIDAVDRVAKRFHRSGFTVAFFVLGILTSISEVSVAINSSIEDVPQISAGNLIGASFVIMLLIVPVMALAAGKIALVHTLSTWNLRLAMFVIVLPVLLVLDGNVTSEEGVLALLVYGTLLFAIRNQKDSAEQAEKIGEELLEKSSAWFDGGKIFLGGAFIFIAGHFLVEQAVFFAEYLTVPKGLIGLILLSIGTNVPELVIAARSIINRHEEIAFGDYIGSAVANTPIFGLLALANSDFTMEASSFRATAILTILGLGAFYIFARTKDEISRKEGMILAAFYAVFLLVEVANLIRFSIDYY